MRKEGEETLLELMKKLTREKEAALLLVRTLLTRSPPERGNRGGGSCSATCS